MDIITEEKQGVTIAHISGYMVADTIDSFKKVFEQPQVTPKKVVLNLKSLKMIDSAGIGGIVFLVKRYRPSGDIKIASAQGRVAETFQLVRLDRTIDMYPSVEEAVQSFL